MSPAEMSYTKMKTNRTKFLILAIAVLGSILVAPSIAAGPNCTATDGNYIVTFAKEINSKSEMNSAPGKSINPKFEYANVLNGFAATLSAEQVCAFQKRPNIESIELDGDVTTSGAITQSMSTGPNVWGLDRIDESSRPMDSKYESSNDGTGATVYIVDTGVNNISSEFGSRYSTNGFSTVPNDSSFTDGKGHGTHVAATAAGANYGVAKNAYVVSVRVLDSSGSGSWSGVVAGLDWIAGSANTNSKTKAVVNMSLGGKKNVAIDTAVNNIIRAGFTVVVAAGNERADACRTSPGGVLAAITVAASDIGDVFASFSNKGDCVDIIAPGVNIRSIWLNSVAVASGTSMASPHVAGVAAIYLGANTGTTPSSVWNAINAASSLGKVTSVPPKTFNKLLCIVGCTKA
jgi:serine protease